MTSQNPPQPQYPGQQATGSQPPMQVPAQPGPGELTSAANPSPSISDKSRSQKRRSAWLIPLALISAIVLFAAGYGVGHVSAQTTKNELATARSQLKAARTSLTVVRTNLTVARNNFVSERSKVQQARTSAANANANAAAKYKADEARLAAKEKGLARTRKHLLALEGAVQSSAISLDGVYVVGKDIKPGIWHTSGNGGAGILNQCYYATLNSTNTSDISDNNNFDGPETVDLNGVYAFQISGSCTWHRIG